VPHETYSCFSHTTVAEQTELWSIEAGVVASSTSSLLGDELYGTLLGTSVCPGTDPVAALAQLWNEIAAVIRAHTDELSPARWTAAPAARGADGRGGGGREAERAHFVVFPACPDLYDYKTMVAFATAIEFAKDHCLHVGKRLTIGIFHPNYKHSPKLMSPERHSPFPTVALQLEEVSSIRHRGRPLVVPRGHDAKPKRQRGNHVVVKRPNVYDLDDDDEPGDKTDEAIAQLAYGKIRDLDAQRSVFEVLFNSAAVPGSDGHAVGRIGKVDVIEESDLMPSDAEDTAGGEKGTDRALAKTFRIEREVRNRRLADHTVKDVCRNWISQNRYVDRARRKENRALRYADTIDDSRWTISTDKIAEMEYAKLWSVISDLWTVGQSADRERAMAVQAQRATKTVVNATAAEETRESPQRNDASPSSNQFNFLFLPFANNRPAPSDADKSKPSAIRQPVVVESSILVSTKFCAFNAPAFKRFAITVNAVLKRFTGGRMFLEVFHNEYVGGNGFDPSIRRSPFPMIQVCYLVNATHPKE
jgi:hypothetical protein